jgi:hypothetical protein
MDRTYTGDLFGIDSTLTWIETADDHAVVGNPRHQTPSLIREVVDRKARVLDAPRSEMAWESAGGCRETHQYIAYKMRSKTRLARAGAASSRNFPTIMSHEAQAEAPAGSVSLTMLDRYQRVTNEEKQLQQQPMAQSVEPSYFEDNTFFYRENAPSSQKSKKPTKWAKSKKQAEALFPTTFISEGDLSKWLQRVGIDVSQFGKGSHRSIQNLMDELQRGESRLVLHGNDTPSPAPTLRDPTPPPPHTAYNVLRVLHVANIVVFGPKKETVLVESSRILTWVKGSAAYVDKKMMLPSSKMNVRQLPPKMAIRDGLQLAASNCLVKEFQLRTTRTLLQSGKVYSLSPEEVAIGRSRDATRRLKNLAGGTQGLARRNSVAFGEGLENKSTGRNKNRETATSVSNSFGALDASCHVHSLCIEVSPNRAMYIDPATQKEKLPSNRRTSHLQTYGNAGRVCE